MWETLKITTMKNGEKSTYLEIHKKSTLCTGNNSNKAEKKKTYSFFCHLLLLTACKFRLAHIHKHIRRHVVLCILVGTCARKIDSATNNWNNQSSGKIMCRMSTIWLCGMCDCEFYIVSHSSQHFGFSVQARNIEIFHLLFTNRFCDARKSCALWMCTRNVQICVLCGRGWFVGCFHVCVNQSQADALVSFGH
jgi:hypothetical protein